MNIITSGHVLPVTVKTDCSVVVPQTSTESSDWSYSYESKHSGLSISGSFVLYGDYQCWGITDFQRAFSQLENRVKVSQQEKR